MANSGGEGCTPNRYTRYHVYVRLIVRAGIRQAYIKSKTEGHKICLQEAASAVAEGLKGKS